MSIRSRYSAQRSTPARVTVTLVYQFLVIGHVTVAVDRALPAAFEQRFPSPHHHITFNAITPYDPSISRVTSRYCTIRSQCLVHKRNTQIT